VVGALKYSVEEAGGEAEQAFSAEGGDLGSGEAPPQPSPPLRGATVLDFSVI
jgi:hypothetical protein